MQKVLVRGAGDIATGILQKLNRSGYQVIATDIQMPSAIRRKVALCEAIYEGRYQVEDVVGEYAKNYEQAQEILAKGDIPVMVDPTCQVLSEFKPDVVVDSILAKKNLGTTRDMAPIVIGVGPGFCAGKDVDLVIETNRGHHLGRLIMQGQAQANTGIPGIIKGVGRERVIHAPADGSLHIIKDIGSFVTVGEEIARIEDTPVLASITGVLRGMIREGYPTYKGLKIADIDPRLEEQENCYLISDKARSIGGGVLEAIAYLGRQKGNL